MLSNKWIFLTSSAKEVYLEQTTLTASNAQKYILICCTHVARNGKDNNMKNKQQQKQ